MKLPLRRDAHPQRPEVAEHELRLGRLAEDAHVGDAAVRDEVARPGRVAAELGALRVAPLRLLDLAADGRDEQVAAQPHARVLQRAHRLDVAGERALHVRDAEPEEPSVLHERIRLEAAHAREPRLAAGVRRVHVPVEHRGSARRPRPARSRARSRGRPRPAATAPAGPSPPNVSRISSAIACSSPVKLGVAIACDAQSTSRSRSIGDVMGGSAAARARRRGGSARGGSRPRARASRACSPRRGTPRSRAMQSAGVPAIGLQRSSSESVTCSFAASRPPRSIASATGASSSISISASWSSVSAEPRMFWNLFARYIAGDLARAVAAAVAVVGVDRRDDRAADVDLLRIAPRLRGALADVAARVLDERRRRDRRA